MCEWFLVRCLLQYNEEQRCFDRISFCSVFSCEQLRCFPRLSSAHPWITNELALKVHSSFSDNKTPGGLMLRCGYIAQNIHLCIHLWSADYWHTRWINVLICIIYNIKLKEKCSVWIEVSTLSNKKQQHTQRDPWDDSLLHNANKLPVFSRFALTEPICR